MALVASLSIGIVNFGSLIRVDDNTVSKSSCISSTVAYRWDASLAVAFNTTFSRLCGIVPSNARTDGVSVCKCLSAMETADSPENGNSPVSNSYNTMPSA